MINHTDYLNAKLLNGTITQKELSDIAINAVKQGKIQIAERYFSLLNDEYDPVLWLYKGRLLSQKRDFKGFNEFSDVHSKEIIQNCNISDALSPWYWRRGISNAILNNFRESDYSFDIMKSNTISSKHELAHYYQCFGAVSLYRKKNIEQVQDTLLKSIEIYLTEDKNDEPYFSAFDSIRCVIVNLILQIIIDLIMRNDHIAYRKLIYCRQWIVEHHFLPSATGISEISSLFLHDEYRWVFTYLFAKNCDIVLPNYSVPNPKLLSSVYLESIEQHQSLYTTGDDNIKSLKSDYLFVNNFPKTTISKKYHIHLEEIALSSKKVYVIHGRNLKAFDELASFLTSLRLDPIEWETAIKLTQKPSPYIGEVIDAAFDFAQAIIVLLTPDEKVELKAEFCKSGENPYTEQARANVIFEAGAAVSKYPQQTIFVQMGVQNIWSDIQGIHIIKISNSINDRLNFISRLEIAGCPINITDSKLWHTQGNLEL